jgi:acyl carrier protein
MPTAAQVRERVRAIVAERLGLNEDEVDMEAPLWEVYGADSLEMVELVMEAEEEFDMTIPDDDADKIKTGADLEKVVLNGGRYPAK